METSPYDFGLRLKELRERKHLSQAELAGRVNLSSGTISRYENNVQEPPLKVAVELCRILDCSLDYLMNLESGGDMVLRLDGFNGSREIKRKYIELAKSIVDYLQESE